MRYVYVLRVGATHYKVGITSNVLKRVKGIQTSNPQKIHVVLSRPVQNPEQTEKDLHTWLAEYRMDGGKEWFELTAGQVLELIIKITNIELSSDITDYLAVRNLNIRMDNFETKLRGILEHLKLIPTAEELLLREKTTQEKEITDKEMIDDAIKVITRAGHASASLLQRRLSIGYARAARLIDELESKGIVGPADGAKQRHLL